MDRVLSSCTASISEFKRNPNQLLEQANGEPIAILNHNRPVAYVLTAEAYAGLLAKLEDDRFSELAEKRYREDDQGQAINLDDL